MPNCREVIFFDLWDKGFTAHMQSCLNSKYSRSVLNVPVTDLSWKSALPLWSWASSAHPLGEVMVQGGPQCLPSLPWCSSYPVLATPEGYLIASVTSVIWSSPAGRRGRRAVLARQVHREGGRKNSVFLEPLRVCFNQWFETGLIHWNMRVKKHSWEW